MLPFWKRSRTQRASKPVPIGTYRGFSMSLTVENFGRTSFSPSRENEPPRDAGQGRGATLTRIDNALNAMPDRLQNVRNTLDALTAQMETAKAELGKPFPQEDELRTKSARLAELNAELNIDDRTPMEQMAEDAPAVQSAKAERPSVLAKKLKAPLSQPCAEDKNQAQEQGGAIKTAASGEIHSSSEPPYDSSKEREGCTNMKNIPVYRFPAEHAP